jgi:oligopeptide/dipeptide ABC transporter ATP-binding protein
MSPYSRCIDKEGTATNKWRGSGSCLLVRELGNGMLRVDDIMVTHGRSADAVVLTGPVSFSIDDGEIFGLVGESGSGKSMTALALMRLTPAGFPVTGRAVLDGTDVVAASERQMRTLRGSDLAMIFQEPTSALNPVFTLEQQLVAAIRAHKQTSRAAARERAIELLRTVGIPDPQSRLGVYPHQLSGGMCQRVMIAMALASGARFLIADEATTSLDVTIQEQIIQLIERLVVETGLSVLFISHDLGVVARICHRVAVLYAGEVVEAGDAETLLNAPLHPYSKGLVDCAPDLSEIGHVQRGIPGTPPHAGDWPQGCRFAPRCAFAQARCSERQALRTLATGHQVRCCRAEELAADA